MKRVLDRSDERILAELTRNARIPHAELAEKVNLSRNAVRQRIERLERDNWIQGTRSSAARESRAPQLLPR